VDSLTEKIVETEKLLREYYIKNKGTRTPDLPKVLPRHSAVKRLSAVTKDILELWNFYKSWQFGRKLERQRKKEPKSTIKPRKPGYNMEEDLSLDDRQRGHI